MKKINKIILAVILTFTVVVSCDKKLEVLDKNNPTQESYFNTAAELQNGVNAIYSTIRSGQLMGREWFFLHDMRGAETNAGGPQLEAPRAELLFQNNATPSNAVMTSVWNGCYQMINRANLIFAKAPGISDNTSLRDRVVGEAKFLRAWAYFELVSQWGDVPMYTDPIESSTGFKGKESSANIYALILSDLADAVSKLPATYGASDRGRATKGAANALLGRVLMQKGDYTGAKAALLAVVNSNLYSLVANYLENFDGDVVGGPAPASGHEFNSESVFEVVFYDKGDNNFNWAYNGEGSSNPVSTVRPQDYGIVWGNVIPSNRLLNEYEANDPRYKFSVYTEGDQVLTAAGTRPGQVMTNADMNIATSSLGSVIKKRIYRKYLDIDWILSSFHPGGINQRVIRYADILLMLAECEAEVGTPAQAAIYINMVRSRPSVNMPPVALATKPLALKAVMHERAVELACESVANIDILRWRAKGYFPSIMPDPVPGQVDKLPIPQSELASNPKIQ